MMLSDLSSAGFDSGPISFKPLSALPGDQLELDTRVGITFPVQSTISNSLEDWVFITHSDLPIRLDDSLPSVPSPFVDEARKGSNISFNLAAKPTPLHVASRESSNLISHRSRGPIPTPSNGDSTAAISHPTRLFPRKPTPAEAYIKQIRNGQIKQEDHFHPEEYGSAKVVSDLYSISEAKAFQPASNKHSTDTENPIIWKPKYSQQTNNHSTIPFDFDQFEVEAASELNRSRGVRYFNFFTRYIERILASFSLKQKRNQIIAHRNNFPSSKRFEPKTRLGSASAPQVLSLCMSRVSSRLKHRTYSYFVNQRSPISFQLRNLLRISRHTVRVSIMPSVHLLSLNNFCLLKAFHISKARKSPFSKPSDFRTISPTEFCPSTSEDTFLVPTELWFFLEKFVREDKDEHARLSYLNKSRMPITTKVGDAFVDWEGEEEYENQQWFQVYLFRYFVLNMLIPLTVGSTAEA